MASTFLNLSTDINLGGNTPSDSVGVSQKAIKSYVDSKSVTVDSALSTTSTNPVQNKLVSSAISELSANINMDAYLDMIIAGNTSDLPIVVQSTYSDDLDDIIGGTYDNNV